MESSELPMSDGGTGGAEVMFMPLDEHEQPPKKLQQSFIGS